MKVKTKNVGNFERSLNRAIANVRDGQIPKEKQRLKEEEMHGQVAAVDQAAAASHEN